MRSGEPGFDRECCRKDYGEILDKHFTRREFSSYPALVSKTPVNGHRAWKPYRGGDYDKNLFDLVDGMWDHEHCNFCGSKISNGHTFWENTDKVRILCDECHDG